MKTRLLAVFADTPLVFFAVVIGVALTFRVAVGAVRDAAIPEPVAPTFATGPLVTRPEPGLASASGSGSTSTSASVTPPRAAATAEVGAAAKVQPIGTPTPARVSPKPGGHGRRPNR